MAASGLVTGVPVAAASTPAATADAELHDLVVVANRLPVNASVGDDGSVEWSESPGGLVTALEPALAQRLGVWVGWSGLFSDDDPPAPPRHSGSIELTQVLLSRDEVELYYEGFSNSALWPLYHDALVTPVYHRREWDAYRGVNQRFADAVAAVAAPGATVWVHDYQLQLVPAMLRVQRPDLRIGFFLHIPFPPTELFAQLPWRRDIIEGLLGADLVGFHVPGGAANFLALTHRLLGLTPTESSVEVPDRWGNRTVQVGAFPISIDTASVDALARTEANVARAAEIRKSLGEPRTVLLGVDRLDYTKGIDIRLKAYYELLEDGELDPAETVLVQVATPSREGVEEYQRIRDEIELVVGRVTGDHGRIGKPPMVYLHQSLPREELVAFYSAADVMLVTPLRDGMNLVCKEYVAARIHDDGALVLSEFTGAALELEQAWQVNPYDADGVKQAILEAVRATPDERTTRMRAMRERLFEYDVEKWANSFLAALGDTSRPSGAGA